MKISRSKLRAGLVAGPLTLAAAGLLVAAAPLKGVVSHSPPGRQLPPVVLSPETLDIANSLSSAFRTVSSQVLPSVVAIENRPDRSWQQSSSGMNGPGGDNLGKENPFKGTPLEDMFRNQHPMSPAPPQMQGGLGSGVIIDSSGIVLTNNHVVAGGGKVIVRTHDGREFVATDVFTDPQTDIAVVKFAGDTNLVAAQLGDSDVTAVGDWAIALGQPFGLESTVTAGIISAKNRGIGITPRENFIQTDAAINPGNSGGPLVNLHGEVIGINTAISSRDGGSNGIGFAVPSNLARWVSDQLISTGKVQRSYLGVGIQPVSYELASQLGVAPRSGVVVTSVMPNTPAAKTGMRSGDVIVKFGGQAVKTPQQLQIAVERSTLGKAVTVDVMREGKMIELSYEPAVQPGDFGVSEKESPKSNGEGIRMKSLGVELAPMTDELAQKMGIDQQGGLVVLSVQNGSPAAEAGLEPGMVISHVNRQAVTSVSEFERIVKADDDDSILLLVRNEQGSRFVVLHR